MLIRQKDPAPERAAAHPIAVVAARTGLSRDVIRVWERRYAAVDPTRSPGGQRLYSDEQINRLRLLEAATRHGRTIGTVAGLPTADLERLLAEDEAESLIAPPPYERSREVDDVEEALTHVRALDGSSLDRELRRTIARHGVSAFLDDVVPSLMRRIGDEWHAGRLSIANEHLASAAVLAIVFGAMRTVPELPGAPRLLVATPTNERHAVGAALVAAAAAIDGWAITYLGVDVPATDIVGAAMALGVRGVALSVVHVPEAAALLHELRAVREQLPAHIPLIIGGAGAVSMEGSLRGKGLVVCGSMPELRRVLAKESAAA